PARLMLSEYVEGTSNHKAIEIRNRESVIVDVTSCVLRRYSNGATSSVSIALSGLIAPNDVLVVCNGAIDMAATRCDITSSAVNHNGDDAYDLACDGVVLDTFGRIGEAPTGGFWIDVPSGMRTQDYVLVRRCAVTSGDLNGSDAFNPATEWQGAPWVDLATSLTGLGNHTECP
ncbi:MAG: endonuclease/exonuclease/phosphatase, partial [Sandaracinaceae bacterium]|nr:endonuclease/exonuclease/phosphatase [Sandaracinaceae bacterium]